jgi:hypothetical protein
MTADKIRQGHAARLSIWNRLLHGQPVSLDELDLSLLCGDPTSDYERASYVALRACVALSSTGRQGIRCALRIAILYWFSSLQAADGQKRTVPAPKRSSFHLGNAIGARLTWEEAVAAMKRKPIDYSAYISVIEAVEAEYVRQWTAAFPGEKQASIAALRGALWEHPYARRWSAESAETPT